MTIQAEKNSRPLCVDLDGTLVHSDMFWECFVRVLKRKPWMICYGLFWLLSGRGIAYVKSRFAEAAQINYESLPYNHALLDYLRERQASGQGEIVLCTGSDRLVADAVQRELGLFSSVLASDSSVNLTGQKKADKLVSLYGEQGFDYIGNEQKDSFVWARSRKALIVSPKNGVVGGLSNIFQFEKVFDAPSAGLKTWVKACRLHQWVKNLLLFVPLGLSYVELSPSSALVAFLAFFIFGVVASATYLINDLFDLDADRAHRKKSQRPFASGAIGIAHGVAVAAAMLFSAFIVSLLLLPFAFTLILLAYLIATLMYSFFIKTVSMLDVCMLAGLYTLRVIAGTVVLNLEWSFWLLAFSIFIFMSLALAKRASELTNLKLAGGNRIKGRGYSTNDLPIINSMGVSSGLLSVLVIALYINSDRVETRFAHPEMLWVFCPILLYWIGRVWLITGRGRMDEDPIVFAIRDRVSWLLLLVGFLSAIFIALMMEAL